LKDTKTKRSFYQTSGKRIIDFFSSVIGLILLLPIFLVIAILTKIVSPGPVFYKQQRVGKDGCRFKIVKFRTMQVDADKFGPSITAGGDPRVTSIGRILRTLKLDELPQLWNVFKGEMSLVGPRPEVQFYVQSYTEEQKKVLDVRPGITDPSSLAYCYEEELLGAQANPESYYQEVVLPHKLSLNLEYIDNISLKYDLSLLVKTLFSLLFNRPRYISSAVNR
jgi:lipopolysaccharide/colanic/teichoic acid biosynthesis glycosyltransferase